VPPVTERVIAALRPWWVWRWFVRSLEVEVLDRSIAIAAKAFVALVPFVVVVITLLPEGVQDQIRAGSRERLGISNGLSESVSSALPDPTALSGGFGVAGFLLLVFYATSFGTSLQRVYQRTWRRPARERAGRLGIFQWLLAFVAFLTLLSFLRGAISGAGGTLLTLLMSLIVGSVVWAWTARVLMGRRVRMRPLLVTGFLTQSALLAYGAVAYVWLPASVAVNEARFGLFGVFLSLISWFVGASFVVILAATLGVTIAESAHPWCVAVVGSPILEPDAAPALPPPSVSPLQLFLRRPVDDDA
jgi:membrane protein